MIYTRRSDGTSSTYYVSKDHLGSVSAVTDANGAVLVRPSFGALGELLPKQGQGYYREYVHPTPGINGPGAQRIIQGQNGELYYSPDHYRTFIPLN